MASGVVGGRRSSVPSPSATAEQAGATRVSPGRGLREQHRDHPDPLGRRRPLLATCARTAPVDALGCHDLPADHPRHCSAVLSGERGRCDLPHALQRRRVAPALAERSLHPARTRHHRRHLHQDLRPGAVRRPDRRNAARDLADRPVSRTAPVPVRHCALRCSAAGACPTPPLSTTSSHRVDHDHHDRRRLRQLHAERPDGQPGHRIAGRHTHGHRHRHSEQSIQVLLRPPPRRQTSVAEVTPTSPSSRPVAGRDGTWSDHRHHSRRRGGGTWIVAATGSRLRDRSDHRGPPSSQRHRRWCRPRTTDRSRRRWRIRGHTFRPAGVAGCQPPETQDQGARAPTQASGLAFTGTTTHVPVTVGILMLAAGGLILLSSRRRSTA